MWCLFLISTSARPNDVLFEQWEQALSLKWHSIIVWNKPLLLSGVRSGLYSRIQHSTTAFQTTEQEGKSERTWYFEISINAILE